MFSCSGPDLLSRLARLSLFLRWPPRSHGSHGSTKKGSGDIRGSGKQTLDDKLWTEIRTEVWREGGGEMGGRGGTTECLGGQRQAWSARELVMTWGRSERTFSGGKKSTKPGVSGEGERNHRMRSFRGYHWSLSKACSRSRRLDRRFYALSIAEADEDGFWGFLEWG